MMMHRWSRRLVLALVTMVAVGFTASGNAVAAERFPLRDGDTWVMTGDSITAQHLHSNYFEAFCFARYPQLNFRFRNSGVSGDTVPRVLARFDWDVAAWKPTVVSVELGMNDQAYFTVEQYIANMEQLNERIKAIGARPVYLTASPLNNGDTLAKLTGPTRGNAKLQQLALALETFAASKQALFADQFHAVIDIWGTNKPREMVANALLGVKTLSQDNRLQGVEHLRTFLDAQEKSSDRPVSMMGNEAHPGPPGQLMMAAALLKELGAEGFVSSVAINAAAKSCDAKGCQVSELQVADTGLSFQRLDKSLPFPLPDEARNVLPLFPTILDLSQYMLKVTGLPGGSFALKIDAQPVATFTAQELAGGVNLTAQAQGPVAAQGEAILTAVTNKEALVGTWRAQSRMSAMPDASLSATEKLAELAEQVQAADAKIRAASQPTRRRFELQRAN